MTPNEIATNVSGIAAGMGNITTSTNFTYSFQSGNNVMDDSRT